MSLAGRQRGAPAPPIAVPRRRAAGPQTCACNPVSLTESFNKANGSLGPDLVWDEVANATGVGGVFEGYTIANLSVVSNRVALASGLWPSAGGGAQVAGYPFSCAPDQTFTVTVPTLTTGSYASNLNLLRMAVRATNIGGEYDAVFAAISNVGATGGASPGSCSLGYGSAGSFHAITSGAITVAAGDTLTLAAIGNTAYIKKNGTTAISGSLAGNVDGTDNSTVAFGMSWENTKPYTLDSFVIDAVCP